MYRLSFPLLSAVFLTVLACMGFMAKPVAKPLQPQNARDILYYWFDTSDNYVDYATAADEEYNLEVEYGVLVDENPIGGDQLELGYLSPGKPHMELAEAILYGHF